MHPTRPTEAARLQAARLTIESGLSLTQVFQKCSRILADTLNVARVGVWLMTEDRSALLCAALYELASQSLGQGIVLQAADFPIYFETLRRRKIIPAEMALHNPMTSELIECYLRPLNITSMLDAPILIAGEVSGVLCCEHVGTAREWTTEERDFVESIANIIAGKIRAAEVQQLRTLLRCSDDQSAKNEKNAALARMAVSIAHDFRNILTVIQNCTEIMSVSQTSESVNKSCALIKQSVERGTQFVRELAEYGKSAPKKPMVVDVNEQLILFLPMLRAALGKSNPLTLNIAEGIGKILIDRNHFERILMNLVLNAKDASKPGDTIELVANRASDADPNYHNCVRIEVHDHGSGMSAETKRRLFEPFYTTKAGGVGLGMAIVARLIEHASGTVEVDSEVNTGTTIRLLLPLVSH